MSSLEAKLNAIETLVSQGKFTDGLRALSRLTSEKLPRASIAHAASLARRLNRPHLALRLLVRHCRPFEPEGHQLGTAAERLQYASTLIFLGASHEGMGILAALDLAKYPEANFHLALGLISEWRYREAIHPLKTYLGHSLSAYARAVAQANLLACLVYEDRAPEALALIEELLPSLVPFPQLRGNVLQLSAVLAIHLKRWEDAEAYLGEAASLVDPGHRSFLFIRKWRAKLTIEWKGKSAIRESVASLRTIAQHAAKISHWETVRDCEKHIALALRDRELFHKLYFGTPYPGFREALCREWGSREPLPESYEWRLGSSPRSLQLSVTRAQLGQQRIAPYGGVLHRLLRALASDFYRPLRVAELHALVYPDLHYHPEASPARIKTGLVRLKKALADVGIRGAVKAFRNRYGYSPESALTLVIANPSQSESRLPPEIFPDADLSAAAIGRALKLPGRSARRMIRDLVDQGKLIRTGKGPATKYRRVK